SVAAGLKPESAPAHAGLGWAKFTTGDSSGAIAQEKQAIALDPTNAKAHHYLAVMYLLTGQTQKALSEFVIEQMISPGHICASPAALFAHNTPDMNIVGDSIKAIAAVKEPG